MIESVRSHKARADARRYNRLDPNDPGYERPDGGPSTLNQDRAFQDAMLLAMSRRQERMPAEDKPLAHDSVARRPFATAHVFTASNLEN